MPVPDYRRPAFTGPNFKKGKVQAHVEKVKNDLKAEDAEKSAEDAAKKRDRVAPNGCRWIHTTRLEREACRRAKWREAMHWKGKAIAPGQKADRKNIICACPQVHQGPVSLHAGMKKIEPIDTQLRMDGPIICYEKIAGKWVEVGRESHVGVPVKVKR